MKFNTMTGVLALAATLAGGAAQAEGHYVTGVEGLQGSSVPPAGNYYLGYLVNYDIQSFRAPGSDSDMPGSNTGTVTALANRFVHITDTKLLGADYGFETIIPVIKTSLDIKAAGLDASDSGVGDVYVGPLVLGWHGTQWDAVAAAGLWLDNASTDGPAAAGKGYKSTMLTGGVTYYFDQQKSISGSALFRYEYNGKKDNGVRPGDQLSLEWGVGKNYGAYSLGVVGYSQWQLSNDKGSAAAPGKAERHALGAELVYPVASAGLFLKGAAYREFSVEAGSGPEPKGNLFRLSLVKPF
ncbi:transporter [Malikia sp.]|uniref:SphA family protein n=1 Tax=Malikia sp. TaxID=2070706 RepID=UPI00260596F6|nr:transporter [Malikia sp.]MDD2729972.1 transporter [Malikia sp.]